MDTLIASLPFRENEFKCPSGICLDKSNFLCDGKDDCADGTGFDESVELCGHMECPAYSFKCGTGGCISGSLSCNGKTTAMTDPMRHHCYATPPKR